MSVYSGVSAVLVATAIGACSRVGHSPGARSRALEGRQEITSNVLYGDYVGSESCSPCHDDIYSAWKSSAMHRMTRDVDDADVRAPFDGRELRVGMDSVRLVTIGGRRYVTIESRVEGPHRYRVTRIIGGRTREDFVGEEELPSGRTRDVEEVLPVSYLLFTGELRYKGYSVMIDERHGARAGPVWNQTCIFCHNTQPYVLSLLSAFAGQHAPAYQGEVVDKLLPIRDRARLVIDDDAGLRASVASQLAHFTSFDVPTGDPSFYRRAIDATREGFRGKDLVEVGIGCEACHGGSREHVEHGARPSFEPHSASFHVDETRVESINRTCARCHQVLFSRYPWTWEGGQRYAMPGGSHISSGEARDFLLGGCSRAMTCTTCHDPHAGGTREAASTDAVCTKCHQAYRNVEEERAHTHHDPGGAGSRCINCHMPKKNMSLEMGLTRYHRIGSPTDSRKVLLDRPIECALCHADKSVAFLINTMEKWWNKTYDRDLLRKLYGNLDAPVMLATLERGKPHEQAVALAILGEQHDAATAPRVAALLKSRIPLLRYYARDALQKIIGPCDIDLTLPPDDALRRADICLSISQTTGVLRKAPPP